MGTEIKVGAFAAIALVVLGYLFFVLAPKTELKVVSETSVTHTISVLRMNPPPYVFANIKDLDTSEIYNNVFVGKHCRTWDKIDPSTKYVAKKTERLFADGKLGTFWNLSDLLECEP